MLFRAEAWWIRIDSAVGLGHSRRVRFKVPSPVHIGIGTSEDRVSQEFDRLAEALQYGVPRRVALKMALSLGMAGLGSLLPFRISAAGDSPTVAGTQPCASLTAGSVCSITVGTRPSQVSANRTCSAISFALPRHRRRLRPFRPVAGSRLARHAPLPSTA